jgi:hypothetical protein
VRHIVLYLGLQSVNSAVHHLTHTCVCSMVPVWRDVIRDQGVVGLTAGLSARVPRLFLSQAIQFSLVDIFRAHLQKY